MAFPLLKLLPSILRTIGKITKLNALGDAATALQGATLTPEQEAQIQEELHRHEVAMKELAVEELKALLAEQRVEVQSEDAFVRRARPTGLYCFYAICTATALALIGGKSIDAAAILTVVGPLAGVSGWYVQSRTREKLNGNGRE